MIINKIENTKEKENSKIKENKNRFNERNLDTPKKSKSAIKFLLILLFFGLFSFLIFNSCQPKYKWVEPNAIVAKSPENNSDIEIQDKDNNKFLITNENLNKGYAYYYLKDESAFNSYKYVVHVWSDQKEIAFFLKVSESFAADGTQKLTAWLGNSSPIDVTKQDETTSQKAVVNWIRHIYFNRTFIPKEQFSIFGFILNLLPTIIMILIMVWLFSRFAKAQAGMGGEESIFGMGKSQAKIAVSNVKFKDVAGIEEEKNELIEIVDYLKNPQKYAAMGARTPRGVILYGPPGTGKTLLAKAVAGEANVPFFQVSGSAFEDMLVGVGAKRVRDLFTKAKKIAPSIIFIDELDSVAAKRGKNDIAGASGGVADQTINQLLAEMDGFSTKTGVVVMAATNRLDVIDDAILRPGRFDRHIQVNLPDIKERESILKIHAKNKNISSSVNLQDVARRTPGFSGAQLENVLNEATLLAVRKDKTSISLDDIDEAIDRVIAGPAKKSRVITEEEKKQIAYHEAGHALIGLHIKGGDVVEKITIIPRGQAAGYTLSVPEKQEIMIRRKSDLLAMVATTLGGRAAEEVIYGKEEVSTGASNDLYKITNVVRAMVTQLGMTETGLTQFIPSEGVVNPYSTKLFSENTAQRIDAEIEKIIQEQYVRAKKIIKDNMKELELIVEALLILETIVKNQIDYIHNNLKLPPEALEKKETFETFAKAKKKEEKQPKEQQEEKTSQ